MEKEEKGKSTLPSVVKVLSFFLRIHTLYVYGPTYFTVFFSLFFLECALRCTQVNWGNGVTEWVTHHHDYHHHQQQHHCQEEERSSHHFQSIHSFIHPPPQNFHCFELAKRCTMCQYLSQWIYVSFLVLWVIRNPTTLSHSQGKESGRL